jgi:hypothetical protein
MRRIEHSWVQLQQVSKELKNIAADLKLAMASYLSDCPHGYDWGWYSNEEQRMHIQVVNYRD